MPDNFDHIDTIFKDKLQNFKEKPSIDAWNKIDKHLKSGGNNDKGGKNQWGKYGLFSIVIISFMFVFLGHQTIDNESNIKTNQSINKPSKSVFSEKIGKTENNKLIDRTTEKENPKKQLNVQNKQQSIKILLTQESIQNRENRNISEEKAELEDSIPEVLTIEKKELVNVKKKKQKGKGIKVEITLNSSTKNKSQQEAAPQQKSTIKSLFKKLRKYTREENQN